MLGYWQLDVPHRSSWQNLASSQSFLDTTNSNYQRVSRRLKPRRESDPRNAVLPHQTRSACGRRLSGENCFSGRPHTAARVIAYISASSGDRASTPCAVDDLGKRSANMSSSGVHVLFDLRPRKHLSHRVLTSATQSRHCSAWLETQQNQENSCAILPIDVRGSSTHITNHGHHRACPTQMTKVVSSQTTGAPKHAPVRV